LVPVVDGLCGGADVGSEVTADLSEPAVGGGNAFAGGPAVEFVHLPAEGGAVDAQRSDQFGGGDELTTALVEIGAEIFDIAPIPEDTLTWLPWPFRLCRSVEPAGLDAGGEHGPGAAVKISDLADFGEQTR
jgi:hypothetical protein